MSSIVVALPKIEDAKKIRAILERHGFSVTSVCSTAANALSTLSDLESGVLICGYRLPDMYYTEILECIPRGVEMLLLASAHVLEEVQGPLLTVQMPMKASDLVNTVNMILIQQEQKRRKERKKPKPRSWKEQNIISNAKMMLMQRNHLTEEESHRYIQKCSMDSGTNMVESAQMLLMLLYDEI